jgi:hypothetical protein
LGFFLFFWLIGQSNRTQKLESKHQCIQRKQWNLFVHVTRAAKT